MTKHMHHDECKRWVAYRLGQLGDVALCSGVLSHLAVNQGWQFIFVTRRLFADIYKHNPFVSNIVCVDEEDLAFRPFMDFAKVLARRYKGWGLLDLHGSMRSRMLSLLWKGPVRRYEKMSFERRLFLYSKGKKGGERLSRYTVPQRYYMAVQGMAGIEGIPPGDELRPHIWLSGAERAEARKKLDMLIGRDKSPVALHPYATHALKAWPNESWRKLALQLEEQDIPWLLLGRGKALFEGQGPYCLKELTNGTTLREMCAILSWCRVLVTGDSGPMHLAAAVDTPVVALFGPTTREWGFYPEGEKDVVLERDLTCRPCSLHGHKPCRNNGLCLSDISVDEVREAVENFNDESHYRD